MLEYIEPTVLMAELRARCVEDLDRREQELLAYLWFGHLAEEVAVQMHHAPGTVRRWYGELEHRVLDVTIMPACARYLRTWTGEHLTCCARETKRMIEKARGA
jgi:hypothetical protein